MLEIRLLGTLDIHYDGRPVIISSRAAQSLFAYLALNSDTSHRREKLAGMFWPDVTEEKARAYLRHELWRIRQAFPTESKIDYLIANTISISFNRSVPYWLDVTAFTNLAETASIEELKGQSSIYGGELLSGFYDQWIILEREHLQAVYEQKMARLLKLLESEKCWDEILAWGERWISHGQVSEAAYRALMVAYDALGDRAKVTSTYERCVQALRALDMEPSEQTRALAFKRISTLNVPVPLTSFVGREKELREVANLLSKSRLITLSGSGGIGKTRLSIQVVAEVLGLFPDGVWFLDLAPRSDPALVPDSLAGVVGLHESRDAKSSVTNLLIDYFRSRTALVIFDNCEHLIESCAELVDTLLKSCEHLSVLATSRESLRISSEITYRVRSLQVGRPDSESDVDTLMNRESVRLFTERAQAISPGFVLNPLNVHTIARICQRLDGIPLAIELAAARVNMLTVEQILNRLDNRFDLLTRGSRVALPHHQALRATLEWSYGLLSEQERTLFRRLAVFRGGWTLEATEAVCGPVEGMQINTLELLDRLVERSLVFLELSSTHSEMRFDMLETIQQFAREKLANSGEEEQVRARHLDYFLSLAERAEPKLYGPRQIKWFQKLEDENKNMRAALEWSLQGNLSDGQRLTGALIWAWQVRGQVREGYSWLMRMLEAKIGEETQIRAKLLAGAARMASFAGYQNQRKEFAEASFALYQKLGDQAGIAVPLITLGSIALQHSEYMRGTQLLNKSLESFRLAQNKWGVGFVLGVLGSAAAGQGDFEQATEFYKESLSIAKEIGDQEGYAWTLCLLGELAEQQSDNEAAFARYEEALQIAEVVKSNLMIARILIQMGMILIRRGEFEKAGLSLEKGMEMCRGMGNTIGVSYALQSLAIIACYQKNYPEARSLYAESLQIVRILGDDAAIAECLISIAQLAATQGAFEKFARLLGMAEGSFPDITKSLFPLFRTETEKIIELARANLGEESYTTEWEVGSQMRLEEAVAYALKEL